MDTIKVYNQKAEAVGEHKISPEVFNIAVNEGLVHQAVIAQMGNERQVLAHTKDRSEVRGGGRKPWKQKGTGRARAGSSRSPIWIGGGVTFGPRSNRNFSKKINLKMKQKALCMALSDKVDNSLMVILDNIELPEVKTKQAMTIINTLTKKFFSKEEDKESKTTKNSILVIMDKKNDELKRAFANIVGVELINLNNINIVDLLRYKNLILTLDSVKNLEKKYKKDNK